MESYPVTKIDPSTDLYTELTMLTHKNVTTLKSMLIGLIPRSERRRIRFR